jgi:uncharacterized protein
MLRPVHFEIHAADPARAQAFYESVFGWTFQQWEDNPYWLMSTGKDGPGIDGGLVPRRGPEPAEDAPVTAFPITVDVPDAAGYVERVRQAGGRVAMPVEAVPGVGWLAYVRDTEGNLFGLMQSDPQAQ